MAEMFPENKSFLEDLNLRQIDLMEPFSEGLFVDKDFYGSASIKKVLPVLIPQLNYKNLSIQEGRSAQRLWMQAVLKDDQSIEKEKLFKDLLEYCKLDTYAMVEIWRYLSNIINSKRV